MRQKVIWQEDVGPGNRWQEDNARSIFLPHIFLPEFANRMFANRMFANRMFANRMFANRTWPAQLFSASDGQSVMPLTHGLSRCRIASDLAAGVLPTSTDRIFGSYKCVDSVIDPDPVEPDGHSAREGA